MNLTVELVPAPRLADFRALAPDGDPIVLADSERQPCEIWTRVMGYHRPVSSFNIGKQAEHAERRFFVTPPCGRR